mgnify:CR=1 FL=1
MYIFISHSSYDSETAAGMCQVLEQDGNRCFLAPRDIRTGYEYAEEIVNGIDSSDLMILILSEQANHSPHVLREVERAVSKSVPIIVYKLSEVQLTKSMEYFLMAHQWMNAQPGGSFTEIASCVKRRESDQPQNEAEKRTEEKRPAKRHGAGIKIAAALAAVAVIFGLLFILPVFTGGKEWQLGDEVTLGHYNEEPVVWRVLRISEDRSEAVLIAKDILTMKAFDAPESGTYNIDKEKKNYWKDRSEADTDLELQQMVRGNSSWSSSCLRTWLNAEQEEVTYEGQPPTASAMSNMQNGYHTEPGFLHGFTEEERQKIRETEIHTKTNGLFDSNESVTKDKVYLLSREELPWLESAGISVFAKPTATALEQDETDWYETYSRERGVDTFYWWLRDPVETAASLCYLASNGATKDKVVQNNAAMEGFGVRPVITVKLYEL